MDWVKLFRQDGREINLSRIRMRGLRLEIPAPSYARETAEMEGAPGQRVIDQRLLPRPLVMHCWVEAESYRDSLKARDKLHEVIGSGEEMYAMETNNPGKWWRVTAGEWQIARVNGRVFTFELPLTAHTGVAESILFHDQAVTDAFINQGTAPINPLWQSDTEITFSGSSTGLEIHNKTTGDLWAYNGSTVAGDTLTLKGVRSLKNGTSIFRNTNKRLLTFAPGRNEIEIRGAGDGSELRIHTRFYYL